MCQLYGGLEKNYASYVHLIEGGTITNIGDVLSGDYKIVAPTCKLDLQTVSPAFQQRSYYDEIFVVCQYWGEAFFHKMMEGMPRMAPFLPFLRQHPTIFIHMCNRDSHTDYLFRVLGIDPSRIISGTAHGKLVYLPRSTACGRMLISEGQLLSSEYRTYIMKNLTSDEKAWNSVVLIKRSHKRYFKEQSQIENIVNLSATKFGFRYELFSDNPPPSAEETMLIFYRARIVIAPHGAGLSNMLFCRPGTGIIEVLCNNPNYCYLEASHYLGHRYFGIPARSGCDQGMDVNVQDIITILEQFLNESKKYE